MRTAGPPRARRGFSLVETTVAMLIVGGVFVAAMNTVGAAARRRRSHAQLELAHALASAMLTEVRQCRFSDPDQTPVWGPESGESGTDRSAWDDLDDYDGLDETTLRRRDGTAIDVADGWSRTVTVAMADPADPDATASLDQDLRTILVVVTDPAGRTTSLSTMRSRYGSVERAPAADTTYLGRVGVDIRVGPDPATAISGGTAPLNSIPFAGGGG